MEDYHFCLILITGFGAGYDVKDLGHDATNYAFIGPHTAVY